MNNFRIRALLIAGFPLLLGSCDIVGIRGNGHIVTDQRSISDFTEVKASGGMIIEWRNGPPSLAITTDENLVPYIESKISGSTLRLRERQHIRPSEHVRVILSSAQRKGADLRGAVDLIAHNLNGPKFYVRSTGGSDITLDGTIDELLADMTGAGDLRAKSLQVKTAEISSTGAASVTITVSEVLRVSITGAGDLNYYGNPPTIERHVVGAGSINHRE